MPASRTNRYPGRCRRCGNEVAAEAGLLLRVGSAGSRTRWAVEHKTGDCPAAAPAPAADTSPRGVPRRSTAIPPVGVHVLDADGDPRVIRVRRNRSGSGVYAQEQNRRSLTATGRATWTYLGRTVFPQLSAATLVNEETARALGGRFGFCAMCGRHLEVEESVDRGIGPVCWRRIREQATGETVTAAAPAPARSECEVDANVWFDVTSAMDAEELAAFERAVGITTAEVLAS